MQLAPFYPTLPNFLLEIVSLRYDIHVNPLDTKMVVAEYPMCSLINDNSWVKDNPPTAAAVSAVVSAPCEEGQWIMANDGY